jgi:alkylation response protein AidB-like acyl-CoA dehydrogenase
MNRRDQGRALLAEWEASRPTNFYRDDRYLQLALTRWLGRDRLAGAEPALERAGADSAGPISRVCGELDRPEHLPRLEAWSPVGEPMADVSFHPAHHEVGRRVWRSGVLSVLGEPGHVTLHAGLYYLFAMNGEVPHLCSLACTAGLIKALQRCGSEWMRQAWLPRLLDADYDRRWHGAQFLTEVQGGSDVGANACVARPAGEPGLWRLSGEKWFCSNVSADLYVVSARPEGAPEGTPGVGLFVVPRQRDDGRPNGVHLRRLKNKLGTRTLPTAEVDFEHALAYQLGRPEEGFRLLMGVVINTSRLAVALGSCGMMRRAWVEASRYARLREAFGQRLVDFPAVRQQVAEMRALATAGLASTLFVAALEDRLAGSGLPPESDALYRIAVNANKYVCSVDAGRVVHHAIEILGGNGTIEDLSPLPRLYREVPVQESWEGPHNTLMAQIHRDALRSKMHEPLLATTQERLLGIRRPASLATRELALEALDGLRGRFDGLLQKEAGEAALHVRPLIERIARLGQVALLLEDAEGDVEAAGLGWLAAAAELLLKRWVLPGYEPMADPMYPGLIGRIVEG